jgi:hypothetical protein
MGDAMNKHERMLLYLFGFNFILMFIGSYNFCSNDWTPSFGKFALHFIGVTIGDFSFARLFY